MCLAIPGRIVTITGDDPLSRTARVDFGGVSRSVNLAFTPEARPHDYVLVHVGFAISVLDGSEAARVLAALDGLPEDELPGDEP